MGGGQPLEAKPPPLMVKGRKAPPPHLLQQSHSGYLDDGSAGRGRAEPMMAPVVVAVDL